MLGRAGGRGYREWEGEVREGGKGEVIGTVGGRG